MPDLIIFHIIVELLYSMLHLEMDMADRWTAPVKIERHENSGSMIPWIR
jgi:hypothetical protein